MPRPWLLMALRRALAGTTLMLRNSTKARSISFPNAFSYPPGPSHCPVLLAAATLRMGACVPGGVPAGLHRVDYPQGAAGGQGARREVILGDASGCAREALGPSVLVPEGGVPNLVVRALVSGDEDAAVLPEPVPAVPWA